MNCDEPKQCAGGCDFLSDSTGKIRPLRIRAEAEADEAVVARVTEILRQKECKVYGAESQIFMPGLLGRTEQCAGTEILYP